jgi:hypothetical protein
MARSTVTWFSARKGFGFISRARPPWLAGQFESVVSRQTFTQSRPSPR